MDIQVQQSNKSLPIAYKIASYLIYFTVFVQLLNIYNTTSVLLFNTFLIITIHIFIVILEGNGRITLKLSNMMNFIFVIPALLGITLNFLL